MKSIWLIIAFACGAVLPIQAALNSRLAKSVDNAVYASAISFLIGILTILFYIVLSRQQVSWQGLKTTPVYVYAGGILGAFYVTAVMMAFPKIGPALTFGLVVAGQMIISLLLDHFNILVAQPHPVNFWRLLGIALVITGVVLIRKF